jgi:hypothetical protein
MQKIIYFLALLFCSCQDTPQELTTIENSLVKPILLIDTFQNKLTLDTATTISTANFYPMYIGARKDSILLNYWSGDIDYKSRGYNDFRRIDSSGLTVYVDTTQITGSVNTFVYIPTSTTPNESQKERLSRGVFRGVNKSYPIIIRNTINDTFNIGYGNHIPLIIEAKDSSGVWKPIQKPYIYECGVKLPYFYLPPNKILLSTCKLFEGNYKTKLRVVLGFGQIVASNEFDGYINYAQFGGK